MSQHLHDVLHLFAKGSDKQHQSNGSVAIAARATGPSLEAVVDLHHPVHMCHEPQVLTPMPRSHTPAAPIACPPFVQRESAAQTTTLCARSIAMTCALWHGARMGRRIAERARLYTGHAVKAMRSQQLLKLLKAFRSNAIPTTTRNNC